MLAIGRYILGGNLASRDLTVIARGRMQRSKLIRRAGARAITRPLNSHDLTVTLTVSRYLSRSHGELLIFDAFSRFRGISHGLTASC